MMGVLRRVSKMMLQIKLMSSWRKAPLHRLHGKLR